MGRVIKRVLCDYLLQILWKIIAYLLHLERCDISNKKSGKLVIFRRTLNYPNKLYHVLEDDSNQTNECLFC